MSCSVSKEKQLNNIKKWLKATYPLILMAITYSCLYLLGHISWIGLFIIPYGIVEYTEGLEKGNALEKERSEKLIHAKYVQWYKGGYEDGFNDAELQYDAPLISWTEVAKEHRENSIRTG
jgi:hypothetical protein